MAGNHVLLETINLTQSASSVTLDNIPQSGYTDLKVVISPRTSAYSTYTSQIFMRLNGSTSGYTSLNMGIGTSMAPTSGTNPYSVTNALYVSEVPTTALTSNVFGNIEINLPNYTNSTNKAISIDGVSENNATTDYTFQLGLNSGVWSNTAAITSITFLAKFDFSGTFETGSTFSLYGVAATDTTPTVSPLATGGNIVANDGTYWYHAFLTSGYFSPQTSLTCDALVIGGGGGAGGYAGGGGAGGLVYSAANSLSAIPYGVAVGAGGSSMVASYGFLGNSGNNSTFNSITAGGGGGGGADFQNGINGAATNGSAGGGGYGSYGGTGNGTGGNGGAGNGAPGGTVPNYSSGGGGGAGANGANATAQNGGNGGAGLNTYSTWATATSTGVSGYYAGGGGGANGNGASGVGGTGGAGGGGNGHKWNTGGSTSGVANTGGGGGGNSQLSYSTGGAGGSGIVIIRYPMA